MSDKGKNWTDRHVAEMRSEIVRIQDEVRWMFPMEEEPDIREIARVWWLNRGMAAGLVALASGEFAPDRTKWLNETIDGLAREFIAAKPPVEAMATRADLTAKQREFLLAKVLALPFPDASTHPHRYRQFFAPKMSSS
jgi:hypothetical protein